MRALSIVLLAAGCYSPSLHDGQFTCERTSACPSGYQCLCHVCKKSGSAAGDCDLDMSGGSDGSAHDLASAQDLSTPDLRPALLGGCSAGARSAQDPGYAKVALCAAAWTVPGLNSSTPCGRVVGVNGKSGNTACSSEDNCQSGWHVCRDEADLTASGFAKSDCQGLSAASALWVTNQTGGPPPSPGPAQCNSTTVGSVFGCGSYGKPPDSSCHILQKVLLDPPGTGVDQCSVDSSGAFLCGTQMAAEATTVTKPARDTGGGVICCHG